VVAAQVYGPELTRCEADDETIVATMWPLDSPYSPPALIGERAGPTTRPGAGASSGYVVGLQGYWLRFPKFGRVRRVRAGVGAAHGGRSYRP
jgi:hypothetical protein